MKHKFLITNDVGLVLDKTKALIQDIEDCHTTGDFTLLVEYEYELRDIVSHLEQALDNLNQEVDQ